MVARVRRARKGSAAADLAAFRQIDDRRAFASLTLDYAVVVAAAALASWTNRLPVTLLAMTIIAGRQSALQGLVHSACHYSLFSKRRRNETLQWLFAYPILDSVRLYRAQHLEHHRDFERKTSDRFDYLHETLELTKTRTWDRTWVVFVRPLLGHAGLVFIHDLSETFRDHRAHALRLARFWIVVLAAAWSTGLLWPLFLYWIVPLVWLYPVFDIWAELSDHLDANGESRNQEGLFYDVFLKGHEMYHAVHHLYPSVPYYHLRTLHERLEPDVFMEQSRGPLDFLRIVYRSSGAQTYEGGV